MVNNVQYKWITNGIKSRQISTDQEIPQDWRKGRTRK
jgi:hypothetical protein